MNMEAELLQGVVCKSKRDTEQAECLLVPYDAFVQINCLLVCL